MRKYKIAFAQFPGGGISRMETNAWVVNTVRVMDKDPRIEQVVSLTYADTPITMLRNRAVLEARGAGCDYLVMVDSDMQPDAPYAGSKPFWASSWDWMMERRDQERQVDLDHQDGHGHWWPTPEEVKLQPATIAAPYVGPPPEQCCYVFHWTSKASGHPNPDFQLNMIPRESAAIRSGIQEVAALPTGLILYDMRVFDILPPPWFEYEWGDPPFNSVKVTTEDVYQTRNASMLGLPQFCNWDAWAIHIKTAHCPKPMIVTRDQVHQSLKDAVLRGIDSGDKLCILPTTGPSFQPSEPSSDEN